jgi:hypothetical protein
MKNFIVSALFAATAFGQTAVAPAQPTFSTTVLPTGFAAFGEYNQLGATSKWSGGLSAMYPVSTSAGLYMTTTGDFLPQKAVDPVTGKTFYAISGSARQGIHKTIVSTGRFIFLIGGDVGPTFAQPSGVSSSINVSFSSSFIATGYYQISKVFGFIVPVRMLYVSGIGWNPIAEMGIVINLKNLPKAGQ